MKKEVLNIIKIGGKTIEDEQALAQFISSFAQISGKKILVHGGGVLANQIGEKIGIVPHFQEGRRITNTETLDLITMVYGGLVNKQMVAKMQAQGINAVGLSGADGNLLKAHKRAVQRIDYGFAGDIEKINSHFLQKLLEEELTPVICPLTHDGNGQLLNTNADSIVTEIAIAMQAFYQVNLFLCFDKKGVLTDVKDDKSVMSRLTPSTYVKLLSENLIQDGMKPKLENAFQALKSGVSTIHIGNSQDIDQAIKKQKTGTLICK